MNTITAHFDGKHFVPDEPVDLPVGYQAELHLPNKAKAAADNGADIEGKKRGFIGALKGKIDMTDDFDEPLKEFEDYR